jgi:hypothetical protein
MFTKEDNSRGGRKAAYNLRVRCLARAMVEHPDAPTRVQEAYAQEYLAEHYAQFARVRWARRNEQATT